MSESEIPRALHRGQSDLPFVTVDEGVELQVLQVDLDNNLWIIRNRFQPGVKVQRHRHTGPVFAFTNAGSWKYEEYPEVNTAGSYLFEPAGSVHTLTVPETNTEVTDVWFSMNGANLNLDVNGNVEMVIDAQITVDFYVAMCEAGGHGRPAVIGLR